MDSTTLTSHVPLTPTASFEESLPSCPPPPPAVSQDEIDLAPARYGQLQSMHRRPTRSSSGGSMPYFPPLSSLPSLPPRRHPPRRQQQLHSNHASVVTPSVTPSASPAGSPQRASAQRKRSLFDARPAVGTAFPSLSLGAPSSNSNNGSSRPMYIKPRPALISSNLKEWHTCPAVSSTPSAASAMSTPFTIPAVAKHVSSSTADMDQDASDGRNMKRRRRATLSDELGLRLSIDGGDCRRGNRCGFPRAA